MINTNKPKMLMLGSSFGSYEILKAAKEHGYYTIVTDYFPLEKSKCKQYSDEHWMISTGDIDSLAAKCKEERINYISAGISEFNIDTAIKLANLLNFPFYCDEKAWTFARDKSLFKQLCRENKVYTAKEYSINNINDKSENTINLPVVIKPVDNAGNTGMRYCYNRENFISDCEYARSFSKKGKIVIEDLLIGKEYGAHYAIADGHSVLFAFFVMLFQPGYPTNCYSLTTNCVDCLPEYLNEMNDNFINLLNAAGCKDGVAWVEMIRHVDNHFYALEMAERPSGDLIAIPLANKEFDTFNWLFECFTGKKHIKEDLPIKLIKSPNSFISSYILFSNKKAKISKIEGLDKIEKIDDLSIHSLINEGDEIDQYKYMIVIAFYSNSYDDLCNTIKTINTYVHVLDENNNDVAIYYTDFNTLDDINKKRLENS